ncbi:MAG: hypothetical protein EHM35_00110 [Planctomycetaceae bacterium]|nr:MAG: hypothetical protein EHM35_00110 [Planctomycetaceae bacterium]
MKPFPELELESAGGTVYPLVMPYRQATEWSGLGLPPIRHWTTRAPFQTGESHWGYAIGPRVINVVLYTKGCDRADMYAKTRANTLMLSPTNGPHKLRLITPDLKQYELHNVWVTGGYELSTQDQRSPRRQSGAVQLTAYDPIWKWANSPLGVGETRDASGRTCMATDAFVTANTLVLPFTGPYLLNTVTATASLTCVNDGSWAVRPTVTMEGPLSDWTLTNATTGKAMAWDGYDIATGEIVAIDIPNKTVTNGAGTDLTTYLSGDFGTFALEPGANTINFFGAGSVVAAVTTVGICWYVELLGL